MRQVARPLDGRDDRRRGAVVLGTAIVEMERRHDPTRGVVRLARERVTAAQRARVALGVGVGGERDLAERLLRYPVIVHEARGLQGALVRGRQHAVRSVPGEGPGHSSARRAPGAAGLPVAAELALRERPEDHDVTRVPRAHRRVRELHRGGHAVAAHGPRNARPAKLLQPESACQARGRVPLVRNDTKPSTSASLQPRILDGPPDRDAGELELGVRRFSTLVVGGLADPGDCGATVHRPRSFLPVHLASRGREKI